MVVIVSGGIGEGENGYAWKYLDSVELLKTDGTWICSMPTMPEPRYGHSQTGPVACSGLSPQITGVRVPKEIKRRREAISKSCITLSTEWEKTYNLSKVRRDHSAWASPKGVMLMGGVRDKTTEILTENGDTIPGFSLDYET